MHTKSAPSGASEASEESENSANADYLVGPDDIIHITVEQHPEWTGDFAIGPDGTISIPSAGEFKVEGKNRKEIQEMLATQLSRYINNPRIKVGMVKYNSNVIYVLGQVAIPGRYATEGKTMTVRDAIVRAGLPTRFAATERVFVISPSRGRPMTNVINVYRILYRGELKRDVVLKPGDIVYVPTNFLGKINDLVSSLFSPLTTVRVPGITP